MEQIQPKKYSYITGGKKLEVDLTDRGCYLTFHHKHGREAFIPRYKTTLNMDALAELSSFLLKNNEEFKRRFLATIGLYAQTTHFKLLFKPNVKDADGVYLIKD